MNFNHEYRDCARPLPTVEGVDVRAKTTRSGHSDTGNLSRLTFTKHREHEMPSHSRFYSTINVYQNIFDVFIRVNGVIIVRLFNFSKYMVWNADLQNDE
jgi:hypothetical protein